MTCYVHILLEKFVSEPAPRETTGPEAQIWCEISPPLPPRNFPESVDSRLLHGGSLY